MCRYYLRKKVKLPTLKTKNNGADHRIILFVAVDCDLCENLSLINESKDKIWFILTFYFARASPTFFQLPSSELFSFHRVFDRRWHSPILNLKKNTIGHDQARQEGGWFASGPRFSCEPGIREPKNRKKRVVLPKFWKIRVSTGPRAPIFSPRPWTWPKLPFYVWKKTRLVQ